MIPKCIKQKQLEDKVDKLSTYSTEEQVIGTWIDGKILYRKTILYNGSMSNDLFIEHGIENIYDVINVFDLCLMRRMLIEQ